MCIRDSSAPCSILTFSLIPSQPELSTVCNKILSINILCFSSLYSEIFTVLLCTGNHIWDHLFCLTELTAATSSHDTPDDNTAEILTQPSSKDDFHGEKYTSWQFKSNSGLKLTLTCINVLYNCIRSSLIMLHFLRQIRLSYHNEDDVNSI